MDKFLEIIETRRSCRKYKAELPKKALLEQIARAGTYAPSGKGRQSAKIVVITDKDVIAQLSRMNAEILGVKTDPFYGAPALMVVLADSTVPTYVEDGSVVLENLMLAAHALGLGSCWIHRARQEFASSEGKELLKKWGIPDTYAGIGHCILGYADQANAESAPRKKDFITWVE